MTDLVFQRAAAAVGVDQPAIAEHIALADTETDELAAALLPVLEKYADWFSCELMLLAAVGACWGPKAFIIYGVQQAKREASKRDAGAKSPTG